MPSLARTPIRRRGRRGVLALATAAALTLGVAPAVAAPAGGHPGSSPATVDLGPNVRVFDPSMPVAQIQATVDAIAAQQVDNHFGTERYALLFRPGTYGTAEHPLKFQVGYYTEVAGLGASPRDVTINGSVDVYNRCYPTPPGAPSDCTALNNFWRSMSNLTIQVAGGEGCRTGTEFWAASQAAPMRRVQVDGGTSLMDYCSAGPQYASGGFIADSAISSTVVSGSQQQYLTRNTSVGGWSNGVWNQVFSGVEGAPATNFAEDEGAYTTLATTPLSREKPYLYVDARGRWNVFVPSARRDSRGPSWAGGREAGRSVPLSDFYVARPGDSIATINSNLARGKHLLLTPGVYDVSRSIEVKRADTVVLGLGIATLTAQRGATAIDVADVPGVVLAGVTVDAGAQRSAALVRIGSRHGSHGKHASDPANPTALQDVFFRIGGPHVGRAAVSLEVNSDDVLLDDIWAWRADHGEGVGWTVNTAENGVVVNGDDVTATGLFVEHYQEDNVVWNGERGRTVFFQNELPYDAPNQDAWRQGDTLGYAAYRVADHVRTHELWGAGAYIYTNVNPTLHASNGFVVPVTPGVRLHDLLTISLNKAGTIDHVVNGVGGAVTPEVQGPSKVVEYPAS